MLGVGATPAQASIFNVTTTAATYDGVCDDHCTLWDAVYVGKRTPRRAHGLRSQRVVHGHDRSPDHLVEPDPPSRRRAGHVGRPIRPVGSSRSTRRATPRMKGFLITNGEDHRRWRRDPERGHVDPDRHRRERQHLVGLRRRPSQLRHRPALRKPGRRQQGREWWRGNCNSNFATLTLIDTGVGFNQSTGGSGGPDGGAGIWNRGRADIVRSRVGGKTVVGGFIWPQAAVSTATAP